MVDVHIIRLLLEIVVFSSICYVLELSVGPVWYAYSHITVLSNVKGNCACVFKRNLNWLP